MIKLEIRLNDHTSTIVEVDKYNPNELAERLNDPNLQMVVIGDAVLQRYGILRVAPYKEVTE